MTKPQLAFAQYLHNTIANGYKYLDKLQHGKHLGPEDEDVESDTARLLLGIILAAKSEFLALVGKDWGFVQLNDLSTDHPADWTKGAGKVSYPKP